MTIDPAELAQISDRVDEAIANIATLRDSVDGMTKATNTLAEIQLEQRALREKAETAEKLAVVTRTEARTREIRTGRRVRNLAIGGLLAICLLILGAAVIANRTANQTLNRATELINEANSTRIPTCIQRNASNEAQIMRERTLASVPGIDPVSRQAHTDSADALQRLLVDCNQYKRLP